MLNDSCAPAETAKTTDVAHRMRFAVVGDDGLDGGDDPFATLVCRPDLWRNTLFGGAIFFALYTAFMLGLKWLWPGYIEAVWNLDALLAWRPWGLPMEELMFGFAFGMYWSGVYEHITWQQCEPRSSLETHRWKHLRAHS